LGAQGLPAGPGARRRRRPDPEVPEVVLAVLRRTGGRRRLTPQLVASRVTARSMTRTKVSGSWAPGMPTRLAKKNAGPRSTSRRGADAVPADPSATPPVPARNVSTAVGS